MATRCYRRGGENRDSGDSGEYRLAGVEAASKRSSKNLFKTALEKINKKYRRKKKAIFQNILILGAVEKNEIG